MITPKKTFRASPQAKGWTDIMDSKQFHAGAQAALAQMQIEAAFPNEMATATARQYEVQGAQRFLAILMSLAIETPPVPLATSKNLRQI